MEDGRLCIIMVAIYCYLERDNNTVSKFYVYNFSFFEISPYLLTHFSPILPPLKRQKTFGFLKISRSIEMEHWPKMV